MTAPDRTPDVAQQPREEAPGGLPALIFGILGVTVLPLILSVVALVVGYRAKQRAGEQPQRYKDELATVGIVLGWVGVGLGVLGMLMAMVGFLVMF